MKQLLLLLSLICTLAYGQNTLTGIVMDKKTHKPVDNASVYVSGTTLGTYTDAKGCFTIKNVSAPCQLIVSHIAYNTLMTALEQTNPDKLCIYVTEKSRQLNEVTVTNKNRRNLNLQEFKEAFLGNDKWGKKAILRNDSVLIFSRYIDTVIRKADSLDFVRQRKYNSIGQHSKWTLDSTSIMTCTPVFTAKGKAPLWVELPLLGFHVYIDLVSFSIKDYKGWADCYTWAYYRFVPFSDMTPRQKARFEKNRTEAYYNSAKHFNQSLFIDELKENGYLISAKIFNDSTKKYERRFVNINSYLSYNKRNEALITGLKNNRLNIYYFCRYNGKPTDLTPIDGDSDSTDNLWEKFRTDLDSENMSDVTFKNDTCIIRANGSCPDNNILFGGKIATKRGGALLPFDYMPEQK